MHARVVFILNMHAKPWHSSETVAQCINTMTHVLAPRNGSNINSEPRAALLVILDSKARMAPTPQGRYFLVTLPYRFAPYVNFPVIDGLDYVRGQLECGADTGLLHWQLFCYSKNRKRCSAVKSLFPGQPHVEVVRDRDHAYDYVWKDDTSEGHRFEHGVLPFNRSNTTDWDSVRTSAAIGDYSDVPSDVYVRYYHNLKKITTDHMKTPARPRISVTVLIGCPGTGKTRLCEALAGEGAYWKTSNNKWWDGYQGQKTVIIDDFDGKSIAFTHLKRWWDRYPCQVETKGGAVPLLAETFFVTSNVPFRTWYSGDDLVHLNALRRRCVIFEVDENLPWVYNKEE